MYTPTTFRLRWLLCTLVAALWVVPGPSAQGTICEGSIILETQEEIDAFTCTEIEFDLTIRGDAISDASGLSSLTRIGRWLEIYDTEHLITVDGLSGVRSVGALHVWRNSSLESLSGLSGLSGFKDRALSIYIGGNDMLEDLQGLESVAALDVLEIEGNAALENLTGLDNLRDVRISLLIADNPSLTSLAGLESLTSAAQIEIRDNEALTSLEGLEALEVAYTLYLISNPALSDVLGLAGLREAPNLDILNNDSLESLSGLHSLENASFVNVVGNDALSDLSGLSGLTQFARLRIEDNDRLVSFAGLSGIRRIGGEHNLGSRWLGLFVEGNDGLVNVDGLDGLREVSALTFAGNASLANLDALSQVVIVGSDLTVTGNTSLASCSCGLYGVLSRGATYGAVRIEDNESGCNSPAEITAPGAACPFPTAAEDTPLADAALTVGPNPASGRAIARFAVESPSPARLVVYDALGRAVRIVVDGPVAGPVAAEVPAGGLGPGTYLLRLTVEGQPPQTVPLTVVR